MIKKNNLPHSAFDQRVGEIVAPVGLKGIIKVLPSSNNPALFLNIKNVLLCRNNPETELRATVKKIEIIKKVFQIQLDDYDSRTAVEPLIKATIFTPKEELEELSANEWWLDDLIGLGVYTNEGELIGTVCGASSEGGQFLEIKKANDPKDRTIIVSFVRQIFPEVDIKAGKIKMQAPAGLLDLWA